MSVSFSARYLEHFFCGSQFFRTSFFENTPFFAIFFAPLAKRKTNVFKDYGPLNDSKRKTLDPLNFLIIFRPLNFSRKKIRPLLNKMLQAGTRPKKMINPLNFADLLGIFIHKKIELSKRCTGLQQSLISSLVSFFFARKKKKEFEIVVQVCSDFHFSFLGNDKIFDKCKFNL